MRFVRLLPVLVLLLTLIVPIAALAGQSIDIKSLALTEQEIGGSWRFSQEIGPEPSGLESLGTYYGVIFGNTQNPRLAYIELWSTVNESSTAQLVIRVRESFEAAGYSCAPTEMGDGPAFRCSVIRDSDGYAVEVYLFRVRSVIVASNVAGPEGASGLQSLAHDIGVLQEAKIRGIIQPPPPPPTPVSTGPAFCQPGQSPQFVFGFAALKAKLGAAMGDPIECEHANPENGDTLQQTTTGLAFYRKSTNTPTFTNGFQHWAITSQGLVYWTGDSIDPPASATPVP